MARKVRHALHDILEAPIGELAQCRRKRRFRGGGAATCRACDADTGLISQCRRSIFGSNGACGAGFCSAACLACEALRRSD
jgi:hypothetical protein